MTEPSPQTQGKARDGIELEPLVAPGAADDKVPVALPVEEPPIPQRPLHLCPNCDYNLTGLISRRCPECGEPFTLSEAREKGFELSEGGREYRRWMRADRAILLIGVGLMAFGLSCPCFSRGPVTGALRFAPSLKTWAMWMVLVPLVGLMLLINLYYEQPWSRVLLEIGIVISAIGLAVAMF